MDTTPLVDNQIFDGRRLLNAFARDGIVVRAAYWAKSAGEDRWTLTVVTPLVDEKGISGAYRDSYRTLRSLKDMWVTDSDVTLVGENAAQKTVGLFHQYPDILPPSSRLRIGGADMSDIYIYPLSKEPPPGAVLTGDQKELLGRLYSHARLPIDDLPYTEEMAEIHRAFVDETGSQVTERDAFRAIKALADGGKLVEPVRVR